jgi:pimeloyl-ACP methyl ester carboxylesterase
MFPPWQQEPTRRAVRAGRYLRSRRPAWCLMCRWTAVTMRHSSSCCMVSTCRGSAGLPCSCGGGSGLLRRGTEPTRIRGRCPTRSGRHASYHVDRLIGDALNIVAAVGHGAQRFHLVGHNWGASLAWQIADQHPERLASLTILSRPKRNPAEVVSLGRAAMPRSPPAGLSPLTGMDTASGVRMYLETDGSRYGWPTTGNCC